MVAYWSLSSEPIEDHLFPPFLQANKGLGMARKGALRGRGRVLARGRHMFG